MAEKVDANNSNNEGENGSPVVEHPLRKFFFIINIKIIKITQKSIF